MVIMEKGHFGQYSGNARHSRTPVTKKNYRASVADDAAHIHYLKMDVMYDDHHGHSDENMTADEKHISKLAGDMKYDKKHHGSPAKQTDEREGGRGTSITEGVDLDETTASLSDMYKRDAKLTVPDFPNLREDTSGRMFVQGQPTGSNPYIGRGSFVEGSVGSVYTPEQISAGRKKYEGLKAKKQKALDYLAKN